jgi:ferritin-like metal-binding protein YciE
MQGALHELFLDELRDLYSAEQQLTKALPKMAKAASHPQLVQAFESHLKETEGHVKRLEDAFTALGEKPDGEKCEAMEGLIKEGSALIDRKGDLPDAVLDAGLIAAAQKVEHYEIASYGTVITWSTLMNHDEVTELLTETIAEEEAADDKLTMLAENGINESAMAGSV